MIVSPMTTLQDYCGFAKAYCKAAVGTQPPASILFKY